MSTDPVTMPGPAVGVLIDGQRAVARIIDAIESARISIVINMFIWRDDPTGNRVGRALLDAANRGVEVTISKDKLGSLFELGEENRQSFFHKHYGPLIALKQRVINAYSSGPDFWSWTKQQPNELVTQLRQHPAITISDTAVKNDHSKFTIIDNELLFVGGMNFEERVVTKDANGLVWHDYMIECHGTPFATGLGERLLGAKQGASPIEFVLNDNSRSPRFEIRPRVLEMLSAARELCRIEMAYFCDAEVRDGVIHAARRGVNVQIVIPAWANIQNERNLRTAREIFSRTDSAASIYLCPDMLHSKMMDIDNRLMIVGSANFNERALNKFAELNVMLSGNGRHIESIRRTFTKRRDSSRKVSDIEELNYRPVKERCEYYFG